MRLPATVICTTQASGLTYCVCCTKWFLRKQPMNPHVTHRPRSSQAAQDSHVSDDPEVNEPLFFSRRWPRDDDDDGATQLYMHTTHKGTDSDICCYSCDWRVSFTPNEIPRLRMTVESSPRRRYTPSASARGADPAAWRPGPHAGTAWPSFDQNWQSGIGCSMRGPVVPSCSNVYFCRNQYRTFSYDCIYPFV